MREHIHRLNCCYPVFAAKHFKVPCLGSRIAADIDYPARCGVQDDFGHIRMDSGAGRIQDYHVGLPMLLDERWFQHIFHIARKELSVADSVGCCIYPGILDGFRHIFYSDHFLCLRRDELRDRSGTRIEVVNGFATAKVREFAGYLI